MLTIICLLAICLFAVGMREVRNEATAKQNYELLKINKQIGQKLSFVIQGDVKIVHLFEHMIPSNSTDIGLESIQLLPSISIPFKDKNYYPFLLKQNQNYFTLEGKFIFNIPQRRPLISSHRNEATYFAKSHSEHLSVHKLNINYKQIQITNQLNLTTNASYTHMVSASSSSNKNYFLFTKDQVHVFSKSGEPSRTIDLRSAPLSVHKLNTNLVILEDQFVQILNVPLGSHQQITIVNCMQPFGEKIFKVCFDQNNFSYFYGRSQKNLYQYELSQNHCKMIRKYPLSRDIQVYPIKELFLLKTPTSYKMLNSTTNRISNISLPFTPCASPTKLFIHKKTSTSYTLSQLCLLENHQLYSFVSVDFPPQANIYTDFTKYRIPFLILSFGVVIYISIKKKTKIDAEGVDGEQFEEEIKKKFESIKTSFEEEEQVQASGSSFIKKNNQPSKKRKKQKLR